MDRRLHTDWPTTFVVGAMSRPDSFSLAEIAAVVAAIAGSCATGIVTRYLLAGASASIPVLPFVIVTALLLGPRAGLMTLAGCLLAAWYVYMGVPWSWVVSEHEARLVVATAVVGGVMIALSIPLRRAMTNVTVLKLREEFLAREVIHRMHNSLSLVGVISRHTFSSKGRPHPAQANFDERLTALADANGILMDPTGSASDLRSMIESSLAPFGQSDGPQFQVQGPPASLEARAVGSFRMAMHELATNASKYGALSAPGGQVSVVWTIAGEPSTPLRLVWTERGGPPVAPPTREGFGSFVIQRGLAGKLARDIRMNFEPEGLTVEIEVPPHLFERAAQLTA